MSIDERLNEIDERLNEIDERLNKRVLKGLGEEVSCNCLSCLSELLVDNMGY